MGKFEYFIGTHPRLTFLAILLFVGIAGGLAFDGLKALHPVACGPTSSDLLRSSPICDGLKHIATQRERLRH